jgi:RNA polymerase sigma-70 factor (ECF subfamily)
MLTFDQLYSLHANDVYRFSMWLAGDAAEAEDITAETFVKVWGRVGSIRMETLKGYLFKIARNIYLQRRRKSGRTADLSDDQIDTSPGPERVFEIRASLEAVEAFLKEVPESDRTAFLLRALYDIPYEEIARILDISAVNARVKVHRIRKQMLFRGLGG